MQNGYNSARMISENAALPLWFSVSVVFSSDSASSRNIYTLIHFIEYLSPVVR